MLNFNYISDMFDVWNSKMELANELNLTSFVFTYNRKMYYSEWRKNTWSDPVEVSEL